MNFQFKNPIKLTRDFILSHLTEEQIMAFYLRVPINSKKLFRSPLRRDRSVTCSIFRSNKGNLLFKDFATGEALNCFEVVKRLNNCDYQQALRIIANDFALLKDNTLNINKGLKIDKSIKIKDKRISKIQVQIQDFTELELKWWNKYGITPEILKKFNVYSCKYVFLNEQLLAESQQNCPIFGYYGGKVIEDGEKIELWRCYFPKRKRSYRFISNWPAKKIQGYEQLTKSGKLLVITKAMKDVMCLHSCGITAIAPCSENLFISDSVLEDLKKRFKYIVVFYDNDIPGISNIRKIRNCHPELNFFFIPRKYEAKDSSDFYAKYGRKKTLETIKHYVQQLNVLGNKNFDDF